MPKPARSSSAPRPRGPQGRKSLAKGPASLRSQPKEHTSLQTPHPPRLDPFDLYELCVTNAGPVTAFLAAVHGKSPRTLREDFSGTAATARAWAALSPKHHAIAVDIDPAVLQRAVDAPRVRGIVANAATCDAAADIISATNFPLGYWHDRKALVAYLKAARASLTRGGVFVADTYGGTDAFREGSIVQLMRGPAGELIEYTFEQRLADQSTARVLDALHFSVRPDGLKPRRKAAKKSKPSKRATPIATSDGSYEFRDAFVYDWRLWSIPELRDAMLDAGFASVEVYDRLGDAMDGQGRIYVRPLQAGEPLDENWVAYVAARA